ncbi:STAS domain-containing protein [Streptomyces sp. NPDC058947]|uniref:STAS domain-containing protein n=1 Tax=Streptomyces sp. NPDC058947 TaxID=3346675 RepID=UPI0036B9917F
MPEPAYSARSHPEGGAAGTASDDAPTAMPLRRTPLEVVPHGARMTATPDGDRMRVALWGELDLDSRRLLPDLLGVLALSGSGIDLELDAVEFCDCSGLGVLMDLRTRALGQGRTVTVRSAGTAVGRLLDLTGTRELFEDPLHRPGPSADPARDAMPDATHTAWPTAS